VDYGAGGGVENFVGAQVPHFKEALFLHPWLLALHLRWQAFLSVVPMLARAAMHSPWFCMHM